MRQRFAWWPFHPVALCIAPVWIMDQLWFMAFAAVLWSLAGSGRYAVVGGAAVGTVCIFLPSLLMVVLVEPWFSRFRSSTRFRGASQALVLSFFGLLVSVTIHFAWLTPWNVRSAILAGLALLALLRKVDVDGRATLVAKFWLMPPPAIMGSWPWGKIYW